jgi:antitoxin HigA-1
MKKTKIPNIHPGEILFKEFMKPLNLSQYRVAKELCVPPRRINEIVHGKRSISADTALRLSRFYGTSPQFWLNLQIRFDLENEKEKSLDRIEGEIHPFNKKAA